MIKRLQSVLPGLASSANVRRFSVLLALLLPLSLAHAGPWFSADDVRLRHDLQLLADAGVLVVPLTTWPVPVDDVAQGLQAMKPESLASDALRGAYVRVNAVLQREAARNRIGTHVRLAAANELPVFRGFGELQREKIEVTAGFASQGDTIFYRLDASAVENPDDDSRLRGDGSYLGARWGNWLLSTAAVDRWWGPGWNGSLILSSNARPVPAVVVQRNQSTAFETPWLRWIGPWNFIFFMGQLDDEATIPNARLMGMRLSLKPLPALEIGFARTAQWGGEGRPDDFDTFLNLLLGRDNLGDSGVGTSNEPGNQLAGWDFRWASPVFNLPYALYGQLIGEDQTNGAVLGWPSKNIALAGIEIWRAAGTGPGSGRLYVEYADTAVEFYRSNPLYDTAYEHHIYLSGYRYYGLCLGHSLCGDGRMTTVGYVHVAARGDLWEGVVRKASPDRNATPSRSVLQAGITYTLIDGPSRYVAGVGLDHVQVDGSEDSIEGRLSLQWRRHF